MTEPFDNRTPPFALHDWLTVIAVARGTALPPDLVAGRMPTGKAAVNSPQEVTIAGMGMIVLPWKQIAVDRVGDASKIVAIQRNGPAFAAGLKPGDVIGAAGRDMYPAPDSLQSIVARTGAGSRVDLAIVGDARGALASIRHVSVGVANERAGEWIRTASEPALSNRPESLAEAARRHEAARAAALEAVQKGNPCSVSDEQLQRLASEAIDWAVRANRSDNTLTVDLRQAAMRACSAQRSGGLPAFEARIFAITGGTIQACGYNKNADYASIEDAVRRQTSLEDYDGLIEARIAHYLRRASSQEKACFLKILADF